MFPVIAGGAFGWLYPESPARACTAVWTVLAVQFIAQIVGQDWKLLGVSSPARTDACGPVVWCAAAFRCCADVCHSPADEKRPEGRLLGHPQLRRRLCFLDTSVIHSPHRRVGVSGEIAGRRRKRRASRSTRAAGEPTRMKRADCSLIIIVLTRIPVLLCEPTL
jgi:hypothetical protein